jgi:uncharacterized FAD-dependent dehydrogenase
LEDFELHDVIIIGAGPAGMFAADVLVEAGLKICIVDRGKDVKARKCPLEMTGICADCKVCDIMCGVGGAGTFSDGTLNLRPDIGGDLYKLTGSHKKANALIEEVDEIYLRHGAPKKTYQGTEEEIRELKRKAASHGARFIDIVQRHIGSDKAPKVIGSHMKSLKQRGVEFVLQSEVSDILVEKGRCAGVVIKGKKMKARCVLSAPGRVGLDFVGDIVKKHELKSRYAPIDVGVRVEVPSIVMEPITEINLDPKFHIWAHTYGDFVRTYCTNYRGFVVKETYKSTIGVNGHALIGKKSENTNFAFLVQINLTEPLENTTVYGRSIAKLATTIGGGKPLVQRLGDLTRGRRSTLSRIKDNNVRATLHDTTPGDIAMALPGRIVTDIIEGLDVLNKIIPGVAANSTLIYAPEIKYYAQEIWVNRDMQTSLHGLYAAGDGSGHSRDLVNAAATGLLSARGILANRD